MPCACNKNRATASGAAAVAGTYRVYGPNGRKVYETTNGDAAKAVGERFDRAKIDTPNGKTLNLVQGSWVPVT